MSNLLLGCPKFYYINLEKSKERKNRMEKIFSDNNLDFERIDAIDGDKINYCYYRLDKYEYGCTLSHLKAIETFYKYGNNEYGIICEDDISLDFMPYWKKSISDIIQDAPKDWKIIMLSYTIAPKNLKYLNFFEGDYHPFNQIIHSGAMCYCINKKGASELLKKHNFNHPNLDLFYKNRPVADVLIFESIKTYLYKYCLFTFPDDNSSTIHPEHISFHLETKELAKNYLLNC